MFVLISSDLPVESPCSPYIHRSEVLDPVVFGLLWRRDDLGRLFIRLGSILLVELLLRLFDRGRGILNGFGSGLLKHLEFRFLHFTLSSKNDNYLNT